jgi:hypothetical protein
MQHQLRSAIYRPTLIVMTPARAADDRAASPDSSLFIREWQAYARDLGGMRHSPLTRVGQPKVLS